MTENRSEDSREEPSVFGNLPGSRPGTRSPLRDGVEAKARQGRARAEPEAGRAADERAREEPDAEHGRGLEDLAWAGIAAAAEAATIGVRLASRTMEALRGSDRR